MVSLVHSFVWSVVSLVGRSLVGRLFHFAGRFTLPVAHLSVGCFTLSVAHLSVVSLCRSFHFVGRFTLPVVSLCRSFHFAGRFTLPVVSLCRSFHFAGRSVVSLTHIFNHVAILKINHKPVFYGRVHDGNHNATQIFHERRRVMYVNQV